MICLFVRPHLSKDYLSIPKTFKNNLTYFKSLIIVKSNESLLGKESKIKPSLSKILLHFFIILIGSSKYSINPKPTRISNLLSILSLLKSSGVDESYYYNFHLVVEL